MSKFKVGDEVVMYDYTKGVVVHYEPKEENPYLVWNSDIDDTEWCNESALQLVNTTLPITVYAVCDDSEGLLPVRVFMFEDNAREYARLNSPQGYSIRPFALIPINE